MYRFTKKQKNTKKPADSREKKEEKIEENIEIVQNTASHAGAVTGEKE